RRAVERRGVPSAETDEAVHRGDGPPLNGSPGAAPASAARPQDRAGRRRVPADGAGPASGHQPGHGAAVAACGLAERAARRRRASRDLGGRKRTPSFARAPRSPAAVGEQEASGETAEAKTAAGAVNSPWPARRSSGPPYLHLRRHHGWQIEQANKDVKEVGGRASSSCATSMPTWGRSTGT